jgi:hypothetical protein
MGLLYLLMCGFKQEKLQFTFKSTKRGIIQIKITKEGAKMNYPVYPSFTSH